MKTTNEQKCQHHLDNFCCDECQQSGDKRENITERLASLHRVLELTKSGYAGVLAGGTIVDRREHPTAIPIPKNGMLGVPEPKPF